MQFGIRINLKNLDFLKNPPLIGGKIDFEQREKSIRGMFLKLFAKHPPALFSLCSKDRPPIKGGEKILILSICEYRYNEKKLGQRLNLFRYIINRQILLRPIANILNQELINFGNVLIAQTTGLGF